MMVTENRPPSCQDRSH